MLFSTGRLVWISVLFISVIMVFNVTGMMITQATEATTRNVVDGARTLCVWITMVVLNQLGTGYGEDVGWYSYIEGAGFLILILGMFVYYQVLKLPCLPPPLES